MNPRPGFAFEAIATSTALAFEEGAGPDGEDKFYFFNAKPIEYTESNVSAGVVQWQYGEQSTADPVRTRNAINNNIVVGDRLVIMLGADGLGIVLVKLC
ncbi:hypothetical protein Mal15_21920 [Stieleria maiorica]|uniref:Uncharacterized protein n=1 Tax=Stieleria maiorica TaxID=2795974 RepID=A0A5B9MEX8_9BACT|nr:hypothetical protein [Stieleria maiorica]QEF98144.1 hypothetical protein Mal15_21920 [Stieleria maiorica]